ncbi:BAG family molecular chaperone regulator 1-like [Impatiens glandulifera]|uniref:BAG family molecular chaperone regulator 1-like n=1 Tax=Impatiens glandulifera TaxID=253017 RepID=UPI001FB1232F|nr:BAG family molecular chaperone regulator 1-like [Impatiens glandulifera]
MSRGNHTAACWEVRPGGMLVQKRTSDQSPVLIPTIKVSVKYGSSSHGINISPHASFGELKKMVVGIVRVQAEDQKLFYKEKERDSRGFLDEAGVKNGSKIVLVEDEISRERRFIQSRKTAQMEKAFKDITEISSEIDKLAKQVACLVNEIECGKRVVEKVLLNLIELLMTQLIKLDSISADGDVKLQRRMQVKRVQKNIEILDAMKMKNASWRIVQPQKEQLNRGKPDYQEQGENNHSNYNYYGRGQQIRKALVTTKWETFDSTNLSTPPPPSSFTIKSAPFHNLGRF